MNLRSSGRIEEAFNPEIERTCRRNNATRRRQQSEMADQHQHHENLPGGMGDLGGANQQGALLAPNPQ